MHNPTGLAEQWLAQNPTQAKSPESRAAAIVWAEANATLNTESVQSALRIIYGDGYVLGTDVAAELLGADVVTDWSTWTAGNRAASALLQKPAGLKQLLKRSNVTIQDMNKVTYQNLGTALSRAVGEGMTAKQTAKEIVSELANPSRALMIALTETRRAVSAASNDQYKEAGVEQIEWLTADPCDLCTENEAESPIDFGTDFSSGDPYPPAHPNCRCVISPVVSVTFGEGDIETAISPDVVKEWDEDAHPRDENGRFGTGESMPSTAKLPTPGKLASLVQGRTSTTAMFEERKEQMLEKTTEEQRDAVVSYMQDSYALNNALREGNELTPEQAQLVEQMDSVMALSEARASTVYSANTVLYRVCESSVFEGVQRGDILQDNAYVSTTTSPSFAREMAGYSDYDATMAIYSTGGGPEQGFSSPQTGVSVDSLAGDRSYDQKEILLPRDSTFVYAGMSASGMHVLVRTR